MITKDNLSATLELLGFAKAGQKHSKTIGDATLTVDWKKGEISYPDGLVINERQTCNLLPEQRRIVAEVAAEQRTIAAAEAVIAAAPARKLAILERYL